MSQSEGVKNAQRQAKRRKKRKSKSTTAHGKDKNPEYWRRKPRPVRKRKACGHVGNCGCGRVGKSRGAGKPRGARVGKSRSGGF